MRYAVLLCVQPLLGTEYPYVQKKRLEGFILKIKEIILRGCAKHMAEEQKEEGVEVTRSFSLLQLEALKKDIWGDGHEGLYAASCCLQSAFTEPTCEKMIAAVDEEYRIRSALLVKLRTLYNIKRLPAAWKF